MALIKCEECGKEFSDKVSACPNCSCPVQNNSEIEKEKDIISIELDSKKLKRKGKIFLFLGIYIFLSTTAMGISFGEFDVIIFFAILSAFFCSVSYDFKIRQNNKLVLTNKRLKGSIRFLFTTQTINIPLEKIDNIVVTKQFGSTGIQIMSNKLEKTIYYVLNAEEFCDIAVEEIEKYKNKKTNI